MAKGDRRPRLARRYCIDANVFIPQASAGFECCVPVFKRSASCPASFVPRILRRTLPEGVEYLVVTEWANLEAIRQFAGDKVECAVVPPVVREMMLEYDHIVRHYEIIE